MVGPVIDPVALGIEVLFPLLFLGLAAPLLRTRRHWVAAGSAVVLRHPCHAGPSRGMAGDIGGGAGGSGGVDDP